MTSIVGYCDTCQGKGYFVPIDGTPIKCGDCSFSRDPVNHPKHYNDHPSGVECITITEHMNFCLGNAIKYIWRAGIKSASPVEDLKKAVWYLNREIARLEKKTT